MRILAIICTLLALSPFGAFANEVVGALSQNRVSLTASYSGSEILIFGAIRRDPAEALREAERPESEATRSRRDQGDVGPQYPAGFDVIVVVEGPRHPAEIWRKERRAGIWVNVDSLTIPSVPSFYAVASSSPLSEILDPAVDAELRISHDETIRLDAASGEVARPEEYAEALMRLRDRSGHFASLERFVHIDRDVLFRARVQLPASIIDGAYITRIYLVRDGQVESTFRTAIFVRKDGIERWLYELAYDHPFLYGLLALVIALLAGYGASTVFRIIRNS